MAYFDDITPSSKRRKREDEPDDRGTARPLQASVTPAPSGAPRSRLNKLADYAVPAAGIAALLHPTTRGIMSHALERVSPKAAEGISEFGRNTFAGRFAPSSLSDYGVDASPITAAQLAAQRGRTIPGGSANLATHAAPQKIRADTYAGEGEAIVRETGGKFSRAKDVYQDHAQEHWRDAASLTPTEVGAFYKAIETPHGTVVPGMNPKTQRIVDDLRWVMKDVRKQVEDHIETKSRNKANPVNFKADMLKNFVEDYFPHAWKEKLKDNDIAFFLAKRTIPTIEDGIKRGLTPKYTDPVELTNRYVASMTSYLAKNEAFERMSELGQIRYYNDKGSPAPNGWAKIEDKIGERRFDRAYAPAPLARLFNQRYSKSMLGEDWRLPIMFSFNMIKGAAFAGGGYHGVTTGIQAVESDIQRAIRNIAEGQGTKAASRLAKSFGAPYNYYRNGQKLVRAWLDTSPQARALADQFDFRSNKPISSYAGTQDQKLAALYEKAGGRAKPYEQADEYRFSHEGSYFSAAKRGALKAQMFADMQEIKSNPFRGVPVNLWKHLGRVMDTISEPVFKYYVPMIKNGAFYGRMGDWLEAHPQATTKQAVAKAREIVDSIDDRFGEMIQDNIFWDKTNKDIAKLALVSYSYELGTLRQIGGGLADIAKGRLSTERAAYILALPIGYGLLGAVYQYMKSGKPADSALDLYAPQTGGLDPRTGRPERLYPLGDMKDVVHLLEDPYALVSGKLAPGPSALYQILTNSDWKGDPIHPPEASAYDTISAYFNHIGKAMMPIPLSTQYGSTTGFTLPERAVGMRPAGMNLTNPEKAAQLKRLRDQKAWAKKLRYDKRQENFYGERHRTGGVE